MQTLRLFVDAHHLDSEISRAALKRAAEILRTGGTVARQTEIGDGLGTNLRALSAIEKIFAAKERPS